MTTYLGTSTTSTPGISGQSSVSQPAIVGQSSGTGTSAAYAGEFDSAGTHGIHTNSQNGGSYGLYALNTGGGTATYGDGSHGISGVGIWGYATGSSSVAILGQQTNSNGLAYAGYFSGQVHKSSGGFLIDHPIDPANKYLAHSFVESPDMKNVYDGVVIADANGTAVVTMPSYFEALNTDFRYQLTPIGASAPDLHVREELKGGRFVIAGARPDQRVSWQVTGNRRDAWARACPVVVERDKPAAERGYYKHPEVHGEPSSKAIPMLRPLLARP